MSEKRPSLLLAILPLLFLIVFLFINGILYEDTLLGSNQIVLILSASIAGLISIFYGKKWDDLLDSIIKSIKIAMPSILILLIIGALAGTWMLSGIVPTMIYYGLKVIHPHIFLLSALIICCIVSLVTGSSWSTIATIGIALLGIGDALGIHKGLVAGAIISGAYFGDKMSPLSDTTNLAPAVARTDLFTHIKYMIYTTGPSIILTIIAFTIIGFTIKINHETTNINDVLYTIKSHFNISPFLFFVPIILIFIIIKKVPALPALLIATLLGIIAALIFQTDLLKNLIAQYQFNSYRNFFAFYKISMQSIFGELSIQTDNLKLNELFSTGGMAGMLNTIWLILSAMVFGGAMQSAGLLKRITNEIIRIVKSTGSLITSTLATCIFFNLTASDQYMAIIIPGEMYSKRYKDKGLKPEVLSRTLEDAGTLTSVLIPWNSCGATQSAVLGVDVLTYLPYCFFNLVNPVVSAIMAYANYRIRKVKP